MGIGSCEEELGAVEGELEAGDWFIFREERDTRVVAPSPIGETHHSYS